MAPDRSPFYQRQALRLRLVPEGRSDQRPAAVEPIAWCDHPNHSPHPRSFATGLLSKCELECQGQLDRCRLPLAEFMDV